VLAACGGNAASTASSAASAAASVAGGAASAAASAADTAASAVASAAGSAVAGSGQLAGTTWTLAEYSDGAGGQTAALSGADTATLTFLGDGTFTGFTGCNRLNGTYVEDGSSLTLSPGAMTKMACPPKPTEQETAIVALMPTVTTFAFDTSLVLSDANDVSVLTYAIGVSTLAGTSWTATGINNGNGAVESKEGTELVTITFNEDGTVNGKSACNNYTGTYTTDDAGAVTFGPLASTMMACEDNLMQIEAEFNAAMAKVTTYQIEGSALTLRDAEGAMMVTAAAA
jgi:heat shock protein HslJ